MNNSTTDINLVHRNKKVIAVFTGPITKDKWQQLVSLEPTAKRFKIELPNGFRLAYDQHRHIVKQNPKNFGQYVRLAYQKFYDNEI
jgi:hypothetical protein